MQNNFFALNKCKKEMHSIYNLGFNIRSKQSIMADIYGSKTDVLIQNGLADAQDKRDFNAKLCSLKDSWERIQKDRAPKSKE